MSLPLDQASIGFGADETDRLFNRVPFGFTHNLSELDLFSFDSLRALAESYVDKPAGRYITSSAPSADTEFYSVPAVPLHVHEAMDRLDQGSYRLLMKHPERHDPRWRDLLDTLFAQVVKARGGLRGETVVRLDATILISSAAATTPFHFDPEIAFFAQIEGRKTYHLYAPAVLSEPELERFYTRDVIDIGQVDLDARDRAEEFVFDLEPGKGLHQPQNSPHWVETHDTRSISYSFVFETDASRRLGRARCANHYLRKFGFNPGPPGEKPMIDALKAQAAATLLPVRAALKHY